MLSRDFRVYLFRLVVVVLFLAQPVSIRHLKVITHLLPSLFSAWRIVEVFDLLGRLVVSCG
jgi:hypothetical protein